VFSVMASVGGKKLGQLRVVDLRAELEKRGLDKSGLKGALVDRLEKVITFISFLKFTYINRFVACRGFVEAKLLLLALQKPTIILRPCFNVRLFFL
jgi:hypothetical protein